VSRTKAQRDRDREDLLLAIDELGTRANTQSLALAMDTTFSRALVDLVAMQRAGQVTEAQAGPAAAWVWVRADSLAADEQADVDDLKRQQQSWEEVS
jgi:hypothetical protein